VKAVEHAVMSLVPAHLAEVRQRRDTHIDLTLREVNARLTREINFWDQRANELKKQELAGKVNARLNSGLARQRADELQARLEKRRTELDRERLLSVLPPLVVGGALVIPLGLLRRVSGNVPPPDHAADTKKSELLAMKAVMEMEQRLGYEPRDVSHAKLGYDVESRDPKSGRLRFIEVKGRFVGATSITVTKNEILTALNKPDDFILAVVETSEPGASTPVYIRTPFKREPDFAVTSVTYDLRELVAFRSAETDRIEAR
jgi:hypothetical protein